MAQVNVEIVKRSDGVRGFVILPKRWLVEGLSRGSIAVADWRKTGSVSAERPSHSYGSPQSGSCCESYAFKRDVRGQTLKQLNRHHDLVQFAEIAASHSKMKFRWNGNSTSRR